MSRNVAEICSALCDVKKNKIAVIPSEARNPSFFAFLGIKPKRDSSLRSE
jgi:hypothetical protein